MRADPRLLWELRLCELLRCTHAELQDRLTLDELALWQAYAEVEGPWWASRGDWQAAAVCRAVAATNAKGAGDVPDLDELLLAWEPSEPVLISLAEAAPFVAAKPPVRSAP